MDDQWIRYFQSLHASSLNSQSKQYEDINYDTTGVQRDPSAVNAVSDLRNSILHIGTVIFAHPYDGVYLVAFQFPAAERQLCIDLNGNSTPFGVKKASRISVGSTVLVHWNGNMNSYGYIIGSISTNGIIHGYIDKVYTNRVSSISRTNYTKNPLMRTMATHLPMQYSNDGSVSDSTTLGDLTYSTVLGGLLHMDSFQIMLKEGDRCSLLLSIFDGLMRLTAHKYQLWTPASHIDIFFDRDYAYNIAQVTPYVWEALGIFKKPEKLEAWTQDTSKSVKSEAVREPTEEEMMPYCRMEEVKGWQGQGLIRQVKSLPDSNTKFFVPKKFNGRAYTVFREALHVDGTYIVESAGGLFLRRRYDIPCYLRFKNPTIEEKEKAEEELKKNIPEKLKQSNGAACSLLQIEELVEQEEKKALFAYAIGEKSEEYQRVDTDKNPIMSQQDTIAELTRQQFLKDTKTITVKSGIEDIKTNYGKRDQLLGLTSDGGFLLRDAYGNEIRTGPGGIELISCADINIRSGRRTVVMSGDDTIITANKSCDITAAQNDVHIASYNNVEVTSGLSGKGRLLLENNAKTTAVDTEDTVGEDVNAGGIVLTSPKSNIYHYSLNNYTKTKRVVTEATDAYEWYNSYNLSGKRSIKLVIDDPKDSRKISNAVEITTQAVTTYGTLTADGRAFINGSLFVGGTATLNGSLRSTGSALYTGSVTARNRQNGVIDADTAQQIKEQVAEYREAMTESIDTRLSQMESTLTSVYEQESDEKKPLNKQVAEDIGYRGRNEAQFGTTEYVMMAPSFTYFNLNSVKGKFDLDRINAKLKDKHPEKEGDGVFPGVKRWEAEDSYLEPNLKDKDEEHLNEFSEPVESSLQDSYIAVVFTNNTDSL
jgi:hypothetical protein